VWAHAEYLKLLRSALDGKVFDRIDPVYERYCEPEGRKRRRTNLEIYTRKRPIQKVAAGATLRVLDEKCFDLKWTADNWQSSQTEMSRSLGSAGFSAEIANAPAAGKLEWTLHWTDPDQWLGYNVVVQVDQADAAGKG
jgi:glucoamylase